jgi:hypothetical protein
MLRCRSASAVVMAQRSSWRWCGEMAVVRARACTLCTDPELGVGSTLRRVATARNDCGKRLACAVTALSSSPEVIDWSAMAE